MRVGLRDVTETMLHYTSDPSGGGRRGLDRCFPSELNISCSGFSSSRRRGLCLTDTVSDRGSGGSLFTTPKRTERRSVKEMSWTYKMKKF